MEPIDISSSDDEFGIDEYVDSVPLPETDTLLASGSSNSRILPPSLARSGTVSGQALYLWNIGSSFLLDIGNLFLMPFIRYVSDFTGYAGHNQNNTSVKRAFTSNGNTGGSSPLSARIHNSQDASLNGNVGRNPTFNSRLGNSLGGEYESLSSKEAFERTLPISFQPKSNNLGEGSISARVQENYGKMYNSGELSVSGSRGLSKGNDDDVIMYENRTTRSLPSSLMRGKLIFPTRFAAIGDLAYRPIMGEEKVNEADERQVYQAVMQDMYQPTGEVNVPEGLLSVPLLRHQRIAVAWMIQKEKRTMPCSGGILADDQGLGKTVSMIALIQLQNLMEGRSRVIDQVKQNFEPLNLDDDDENGSSGLNNENSNQQADGNKLPSEASSSMQKSFKSKPSAGTLVVCPASVLRQWARELKEKVDAERKLSYIIYHGGNRTKKPEDLAKHDVVLTTYAIVNIEVPKKPLVNEDEADERNGENLEIFTNKKRKKTLTVSKKREKGRKGLDGSFIDDCGGPLAKVNWHRIILDEAQTIKNHRTQVARACCTLRAKRRWCLSGTPIQNAIDDLFSYFRFLRFEPYAASYKKFYATIKVEISRDSLKGYKKLQAILKAIMLRRTKGTLIDGEPIITLPPKTICLKKIDFFAEERAFYARLESESRSKFKAFSAAGTVKQNYATILLMLLRLRQACDHPSLVKGLNSEPLRKDSAEMANKLPTEKVIDLLNRLEASHAICRECEDTSDDPVITKCGHVFCFECVSNILEGEDHTCPASGCKERLGSDIIFSPTILRNRISQNLDASTSQSEFDEKSEILQREYGSSKIQAVLDILVSNSKINSASTKVDGEGTSTLDTEIESEGPIKAIVFSQWTGMLDLVEEALNQNRIRYRRLDGTMTLAARDTAVKDFNKDPKVTVMLMSLKAGNLGLNMVAACQVILLDLWWNPTTEDQAVDRAHRIGQTRPVTVTRLTIKDTVEDRILALQEEKRKMVSSAFGEDQPGASSSRLTVEDLNYLFKLS